MMIASAFLWTLAISPTNVSQCVFPVHHHYANIWTWFVEALILQSVFVWCHFLPLQFKSQASCASQFICQVCFYCSLPHLAPSDKPTFPPQQSKTTFLWYFWIVRVSTLSFESKNRFDHIILLSFKLVKPSCPILEVTRLGLFLNHPWGSKCHESSMTTAERYKTLGGRDQEHPTKSHDIATGCNKVSSQPVCLQMRPAAESHNATDNS